MELDFVLDELNLGEALEISHKLHREIMKRYKTGAPRQALIDLYNQVETQIFILREKERGA